MRRGEGVKMGVGVAFSDYERVLAMSLGRTTINCRQEYGSALGLRDISIHTFPEI